MSKLIDKNTMNYSVNVSDTLIFQANKREGKNWPHFTHWTARTYGHKLRNQLNFLILRSTQH